MTGRPLRWSLVTSVAACVVLGGCGSSGVTASITPSSANAPAHDLGAPNTSSSPLVRLVPVQSAVSNIRAFRGTIVNASPHTVDWGGCIFTTPWPREDGKMAFCLAGSLVAPHSSQAVTYKDLVGTTSRPGSYRLLLAYTVGSRTSLSFAWTSLTVR